MKETKFLIRPKLVSAGRIRTEYIDKRVKCPFCDDFLTLDNVSILPSTSGEYADLICNSPVCLSKWMRINLETKVEVNEKVSAKRRV